MLNLYLKSFNTINTNSESDIAFMYGRRLNEMPILKREAKWWYVLGAIPHFIYSLVNRVLLSKSRHDDQNIEILFFAESLNQYSALLPSFNQSVKMGLAGKLKVMNPSLAANNLGHKVSVVSYTPYVILVSILLLFSKGPSLILSIARGPDKRLRFAYFHKLISCYIYVPFFIDYLEKAKPKLVVFSNDHNPICRSLLASSKALNIQSVYIQHASVSNIFPSLECDWALLDGEDSLNKYMNLLPYKNNTQKGSNVKIVLSGMKKSLSGIVTGRIDANRAVGIAFNKLDSISELNLLVDHFFKQDLYCSVRLHPGIEMTVVNDLKNKYVHMKTVEVTSAKDEDINVFFRKVNFVVAGESGIHLEALLSGVQSYYYLLDTRNKLFDYYGFIKKKLIKEIKSVNEFSNENFASLMKISPTQELSIKYYSETYKTSWAGREGDLVALFLKELLQKKCIPENIFKSMFIGANEVYRLDREH